MRPRSVIPISSLISQLTTILAAEEQKELERAKSQGKKPNTGSFVGGNEWNPKKLTSVSPEDRVFQDYLSQSMSKSIDYVVDHLDNTDNVSNHSSLKELFHRKGINMRLEWIVYCRLKRDRMRALVGSDILARCLKQMINGMTSKMMRRFIKRKNIDFEQTIGKKEKIEALVQEKNEFLIEGFFKKLLC